MDLGVIYMAENIILGRSTRPAGIVLSTEIIPGTDMARKFQENNGLPTECASCRHAGECYDGAPNRTTSKFGTRCGRNITG